ncbi:type I antifreeze protein [Bifidobacterium saguini DSM 23967]|uniref:Type I antifreeze protein n=1 Tax=Bifidobacterium saguini DSM 23967 TaxID=1437607 RepID=A0A087DAV3_9BIFI|nr:type I antifreeze protein [Bifidobacterium saguini DSM 23967]
MLGMALSCARLFVFVWRNPLPTYHYRCKNCGYDFTEQQSFSDDPITVCPKCAQEQVRKVYSAVPIEFKGHGFYRTDKSGK